MLKQAKRAVLSFSKAVGAFKVLRSSRWRDHQLLVLCYHGISLDDEHEWDPALFMSPQVFHERMRILSQSGATVLPFAQAVELLYQGGLPKCAVTITFDDGLSDFASVALPILERHGFPALVYLTTYFTAHAIPPYHLICPYMLWKRRDRTIETSGLTGESATSDLRSPAERQRLASSLYDFVRRRCFNQEQRAQHLLRLGELLDLDFAEILRRRLIQFMTSEEVAEVARRGVDVQLHTHRHRTPAEAAPFQTEILENRERIRATTGRDPRHFCYPSGVTSPDFLPWLRQCGVQTATTCVPGLSSKNTDPLMMPRMVDTMSLASVEFESWICGAGSLLPRLAVDSGLHVG